MAEADSNHIVQCVKLKKDLPGLAKPPFPSEFGKLIYDNVSHEAWEMWLKESVRYINTYRVDLASKQGAEFMINQMKVWFGFVEGELAQTAWSAPSEGETQSDEPPLENSDRE